MYSTVYYAMIWLGWHVGATVSVTVDVITTKNDQEENYKYI